MKIRYANRAPWVVANGALPLISPELGCFGGRGTGPPDLALSCMIERKVIENIRDGRAPDGRRAVRIDFEDGDWTYWYIDSDAEAEAMRQLIGWEVDIEGPVEEVDLITLH